jgi:hypothetical protein
MRGPNVGKSYWPRFVEDGDRGQLFATGNMLHVPFAGVKHSSD